MTATSTASSRPSALTTRVRVAFAHPSERAFARILSYYRIRWEYEPRTFPVRWDASGNVVESFTPDFFLPDLDLYLELTTLKQSLVTRKNRKLRLLRRLYPEVKAKLFYRNDVEQFVGRYAVMGKVRERSRTHTPRSILPV